MSGPKIGQVLRLRRLRYLDPDRGSWIELDARKLVGPDEPRMDFLVLLLGAAERQFEIPPLRKMGFITVERAAGAFAHLIDRSRLIWSPEVENAAIATLGPTAAAWLAASVARSVAPLDRPPPGPRRSA